MFKPKNILATLFIKIIPRLDDKFCLPLVRIFPGLIIFCGIAGLLVSSWQLALSPNLIYIVNTSSPVSYLKITSPEWHVLFIFLQLSAIYGGCLMQKRLFPGWKITLYSLLCWLFPGSLYFTTTSSSDPSVYSGAGFVLLVLFMLFLHFQLKAYYRTDHSPSQSSRAAVFITVFASTLKLSALILIVWLIIATLTLGSFVLFYLSILIIYMPYFLVTALVLSLIKTLARNYVDAFIAACRSRYLYLSAFAACLLILIFAAANINADIRLAQNFKDGHAFVVTAFGSFTIDKSGGIIPPPEHNFAFSPEQEPSFAAKATAGETESAPDLTLGPFREGLAVASSQGRQGVIDRNGIWVVKPGIYLEIKRYSNGLAAVRKLIEKDGSPPEALYGYIDKSGYEAISPDFADARDFNGKGIAPAKDKGRWDGWGLINNRGEWIVAPGHAEIRNYSQGFAVARKENLSGYYDEYGNIAIPFQFADARPFSEGLAAVKDRQTDRWGYINIAGHLVIPCVFEEAGDFHEGLAAVVPEDKITAISYRLNSFFGLTTDRTWCYIDNSGSKAITGVHSWLQALLYNLRSRS